MLELILVLSVAIPWDKMIDPQLIAVYLSPILIFLATGLANKLKAWLSKSKFGFSGLTMMFIVALLSTLSAILVNALLLPGVNIFLLILVNCSGVFVNEFLKQLKQSLQGNQSTAETKLLG